MTLVVVFGKPTKNNVKMRMIFVVYLKVHTGWLNMTQTVVGLTVITACTTFFHPLYGVVGGGPQDG